MTQRSWQFEELNNAGPEHLDADYVLDYDDKAGVDWDAELTELMALGLNQDSVLIDFGAGTGELSIRAANVCQRAIAVDASPAMVAITRERARATGVTNHTSIESGILTYDHTGDLADFAYSRHVLHHLPDFWKALAIKHVASVLKPGGTFKMRDLIFSCTLSEIDDVIESWLAGASTVPGWGWSRPELEIHLKEEHSTFSWLLEPMFTQAKFEILSVRHAESRIFSDYVLRKAV